MASVLSITNVMLCKVIWLIFMNLFQDWGIVNYSDGLNSKKQKQKSQARWAKNHQPVLWQILFDVSTQFW